jgi:hypothetical protein
VGVEAQQFLVGVEVEVVPQSLVGVEAQQFLVGVEVEVVPQSLEEEALQLL